MILFLCLWQHNFLQLLLVFLSWIILHLFFTTTVAHVTFTGHVGTCCSKNGQCLMSSCKQRLVESVRGLLDMTYAVVIVFWALYLLVGAKTDIESHAFLYSCSLGYHIYALYWVFLEFLSKRQVIFGLKNSYPIYPGNHKAVNLIQSLLSTIIIASALRALSHEMTSWRNSAIPLMMEMHPNAGVNNPRATLQKKALSHHLLTKPSDIAALMTMNMIIHEFPNIFYNLIKLLRAAHYKTSNVKSASWANDSAQNGECAQTAAWRRERGMIQPPLMQPYIVQDIISKAHRLTFVFVRVLGGFITLSRILQTELLVRDTLYVASALLFHGVAIYLFGGIIAYTAKRSGNRKPGLRKSLSWQLATAVNDDWLNYN